MNQMRDIRADGARGVRIAHEAGGLAAIREPDCAAAVWQRRLLPEFQAWIDGLPPEVLPAARVIVRPDRVGMPWSRSARLRARRTAPSGGC